MVNLQGLASYCQDCGACAARYQDQNLSGMNAQFVESVINEVVRAIQKDQQSSEPSVPIIPLGVSNRHIHLTKQTLERLFGESAQLETYRALYQPGDFAARQTLTIVGSKLRAIQNVRILGPLRSYDQVEISMTDAIYLGIKPPVRDSGDLNGAAPLTLVGPAGSVYLPHCAIIASRHLHMSNIEAEKLGVKNGDLCRVRLRGEKPTIFENIRVRTNELWKLQLHLDTDEANATGTICGAKAEFQGLM